MVMKGEVRRRFRRWCMRFDDDDDFDFDFDFDF